ncbi:MAG: sensor histidine kinase [Weeksellaceae bacterium]|nr:sensor histidine kinase [Weeksellaceae bacterium]
MKHISSICLVFIVLISTFSCHDKVTEKEGKANLEESKYENLPEYEWLSNNSNFQDENYQKKFRNYFEASLKENRFEDAAAYLMSYGEASKFTQLYDSVYTSTVLDFYEKNEDKISGEAKTNLCYYLGIQFFNLGKLDKSSYWHKKSLEFKSESNSHKQIQGFASFAIAQNYLRQRDLDDTEKYLVKALRIFEEVGDLRNQGTVYLLMHSLYVRNRAYGKAEEILQKAIEVFKKEENEFLAFSSRISYVHFHIEQGDTIKTIEKIDSLAKYAKIYTTLPEYHIGMLNQFLTFKFIAQNNQDSATYYLNKAKEISERLGSQDLNMRTFFQEILYSNKFGTPLENPEEVERFYEEMAQDEEPNLQFMYQMAFALYDFHQKNGNYKKANEYSMFLIEDTNKQSADRLKNQLFELEQKFETERKEKTILIQDKKLAEQNRIIISLIVASVFIVLIFIILFVWLKNKSIIKEKKLTENFASQLLQKTENERKRIASDLHDSVSNELVNLRHAIESGNSRLKNKIDFILEEVRNISRNISPTLFDKIGLKSSVEQLIERVQNQHNFFISSEINYKGGLNNDKELQLYRIIQEAITNILKHANAVAGKVSILEDEKSVTVEIKDNGKGFDVAKMLEKGNCFGLLNITERAKYLNGTVNFHSDSKGTLIKIVIVK